MKMFIAVMATLLMFAISVLKDFLISGLLSSTTTLAVDQNIFLGTTMSVMAFSGWFVASSYESFVQGLLKALTVAMVVVMSVFSAQVLKGPSEFYGPMMGANVLTGGILGVLAVHISIRVTARLLSKTAS